MNIRFKLIDYKKNDITIGFLGIIFCVFFYLLMGKKEYIIFICLVFIFLLLRFFVISCFKKKTGILLLEDSIKIESLFFHKNILYSDIKNLTVRRNYSGTYDVIINFDDSINIFKYFSNYIFDASIRKNHKKSFIICDLKNSGEIVNFILKKINFPEEKIEEEILCVKYSLFEASAYTSFFLLILLSILNLAVSSILSRFTLVLFLVLINIRFFKKEFCIQKISPRIIKISDKINELYVFNGYTELTEKIKISYDLKISFNYYYLSMHMFPVEYGIKKNAT